MTPVKFIEAVDSYFKYSTDALFTKVHEFIALYRNNNTVLGCLANDLWQPGATVTAGEIRRSPNMVAGTSAKATSTGTTSTTEPTWPATGETVSDGGVTWKDISSSGMETATQAEVTTGTDTEKAVTPATAAGCYARVWTGTTAPTDLSGRTLWLNTSINPAQIYYYNTSTSAWQSAAAYAAGAGKADNANYVNNLPPILVNSDGVINRNIYGGYGGTISSGSSIIASTLATEMDFKSERGNFGFFVNNNEQCCGIYDWNDGCDVMRYYHATHEFAVTCSNGLKLASGVILK